MQIGMVGLGRMGADMVQRLSAGGHECIAHDVDARAVDRLAGSGIFATTDRAEFLARLATPRVLWLMVPAAAVDRTLDGFLPSLAPGDVVVDGGNSWYGDARRRAERLAAAKVHFIDCGTSGGVHGRERGYCLMLGGEPEVVRRLDPLFATLAPGREAAPPTPGRGDRRDTADRGYLHCGPTGAGHFVKMVHNGIEYGLMAAYAEGLDLLRHADVGQRGRRADAESAPMHDPEAYRYEFDLPAIAELWRRGSVIGSWLLDLTASALAGDPALRGYRDEVADSGEGRWALQAAIEVGAPANILAAALFSRFASRGAASFQGQVLSAMRGEFGGHPADAAERERAEEHRGRSGSA